MHLLISTGLKAKPPFLHPPKEFVRKFAEAAAKTSAHGLTIFHRNAQIQCTAAGGEGAYLLAWLGWPMSVMSPSGPIMHRVDVTTFSRSGSSGGFVTCNRMEKIVTPHLL